MISLVINLAGSHWVRVRVRADLGAGITDCYHQKSQQTDVETNGAIQSTEGTSVSLSQH